jgi:bacteriocin-like protein
MEIMIELTETDLDQISGGAGAATFSFSNSASGTFAAVTGSLFQFTTASSASQNGRFDSSSR